MLLCGKCCRSLDNTSHGYQLLGIEKMVFKKLSERGGLPPLSIAKL